LRSIRTIFIASALSGLALAGSLAMTVPASAGPVIITHSAVTNLTNRPDSGGHGNDWALDHFKRTATLTLSGAVALSHCGGATSTNFCYKWTATVTDTGTFTTIAGQLAPGFGSQNGGGAITLGQAITGKASGGASYTFYSSWKTADRTPPASEDGAPSGRLTTGLWPELFFRASGPKFWDASGNPSPDSILGSGGWSYTGGPDSACPNVSSHWVDASPDWGSLAVDGNILAPDAGHC